MKSGDCVSVQSYFLGAPTSYVETHRLWNFPEPRCAADLRDWTVIFDVGGVRLDCNP